ncbi:hypothetical protein Cgig2_021542 [Carnegiea gigantea]|uniref:Uncharacterized protein n=1 Tax=Carnegiea gigantea TaxID=171969 RepID=A0A9Q1GNI2_9CARY|nr:hypothetical protein Cgig2_021542 [Carnegiea gigantea]
MGAILAMVDNPAAKGGNCIVITATSQDIPSKNAINSTDLEINSWLENIHNPPGANASHHGNTQPAPTVILPTLNAEQYQQLLSLLNKQSGEVRSFLAGTKFCFVTFFDNNNRIIDSRTSGHITPRLSFFSSTQPLKNPAHITMPNASNSILPQEVIKQKTPHSMARDVPA